MRPPRPFPPVRLPPARAVVAAVGLVALGGCLAQPAPPNSVAPAALPEPPVLGLRELLEVWVPLPDGLRAHGAVYLPDVRGAPPVPVLLDLGPYYGNFYLESTSHDVARPPDPFYAHFLERGYAIALVSLRGTGQSEGCFPIGGAQEQRDAAVIVEWLAAQPWSDGNVAMMGISYGGSTPWEAAVLAPPSLKAIVPIAGITDMYRYPFFEGVPINAGPLFNAQYVAAVDALYGVNAMQPAASRLVPADVLGWAAAQPTNVCPESLEVAAAGMQTYLDGVHGPYWDERDASARAEQVQAATLVVHGLQDWVVRMDEVQGLWDRLPGPKRMVLGQWGHDIPWANTARPGWDFHAFNATVGQWLDAFVKGQPAARAAALAEPPVMVQDSRGAWWNLTAWPPPEARMTPFHLTGEGSLAPSPPPEEGTVAFDTPRDRQRVVRSDARASDAILATKAAFTSGTPDEALVLAGNPELRLWVSVDQPGGYLGAGLYDLDSKGGKTPVTRGHVNLATRTTRDQAESVPTDTPFPVTMKMYALAHVLQPGHRLVLELEGNGPDTHPHPTYAPRYTVHLGPDPPAALLAPVFRGAPPERPDAASDPQRAS